MPTTRGKRYIPEHDIPDSTPRAAALFIQQACRGGYQPGADQQSDTYVTLASIMTAADTVRISIPNEVFTQAMEETEEGQPLPAETTPPWPTERNCYLQPDRPIPYDRSERRRHPALEGMLISKDDGSPERMVAVVICDGRNTNAHVFLFDPVGHTIKPASGEQLPSDPETREATADLMARLLHAINHPRYKIQDIPLTPAERVQAQTQKICHWMGLQPAS